MITKLAENLSTSFCCHGIIEKEEIPSCQYGLEIIISTVISFTVIIGVSGLFKNFLIAVIYLVALVPLRMYTGGYHANTYLTCNIIFAIIFVINILLFELIYKMGLENAFFVATLWSFIPVVLYAPIENKNKIINRLKHKRFKKISLVLYILLYMFSSILLFYKNKYGILLLLVLNTVSILIMEVKINEKNEKNE